MSSGQLLLLAIGLFFVYAIFFSIEAKLGRRIIFGGFRDFIDRVLVKITTVLSRGINFIVNHIFKLFFYFIFHKFLRLLMTGLVKTYDYLERVFIQNRQRAKRLKIEKKLLSQRKLAAKNQQGHLQQVARHKVDVALTAPEKKKLLADKLEQE